MKGKFSKHNIIFLVIIALLIIPKSRQQFQVLLHKGLSYINQSTVIDKGERLEVSYDNWKLKSDVNTTLDFEDTKGKVVFINFWATWCPPCIAEMPNLQKLYTDYNDKVVFLFITSDNFEITERFKIKKGFDFDVYNPLNGVPEALSFRTIPRTFVINKDGEIVIDEASAINWNSEKVRGQLDQLLAE